jgi:hypothetical protein
MHSLNLAKLLALFLFALFSVVQAKTEDACGDFARGPLSGVRRKVLNLGVKSLGGELTTKTTSGRTEKKEWKVETVTDGVFTGAVHSDNTLTMEAPYSTKGKLYYVVIIANGSGTCWARTVVGASTCHSSGVITNYSEVYAAEVWELV